MPLEFVDFATAEDAEGIRLVVSSLVPSPWSEAAKGCLLIAGLPAMLVRRGMDKAEIDAWTGVDNVPVLVHDAEPIRTHWAAIVTFVDRLARDRGGTPILPYALTDRVRTAVARAPRPSSTEAHRPPHPRRTSPSTSATPIDPC